jgi:hypothetical protein
MVEERSTEGTMRCSCGSGRDCGERPGDVSVTAVQSAAATPPDFTCIESIDTLLQVS